MNSESEQTQPHSADKPSGSGHPSQVVTGSSSSRRRLSVEERAIKYLGTLDNAISGQHGHDRCFHAACVLVVGFGLTVDEARPCLSWFNTNKCAPPFSDKELEHKLVSASKKSGPRGLLLGGSAPVRAPVQAKAEVKPIESTESPALALGEYLETMISGANYAACWPWPKFHNLTKALKPGTITLLSAAQGTSKSLFILEAASFWVCKKGYSVAVLELEEDRNYHLTRALAQIEGNSNITDDAWIREHVDETREMWARHANELNALGAAIWEGPTTINTDSIIAWLRSMCAVGKRIIVIDPITARDPSERPWIDDHRFMATAKDILKPSGASLVLVTHPPKGLSQDNWGGDVAGGAAYLRFSQTVVYLRGMPEVKELPIVESCGNTPMPVNRKVELKKTRNGKGWFASIGMYLDPKTLRHVEQGIIAKSP
jgi:hypothetical protein